MYTEVSNPPTIFQEQCRVSLGVLKNESDASKFYHYANLVTQHLQGSGKSCWIIKFKKVEESCYEI